MSKRSKNESSGCSASKRKRSVLLKNVNINEEHLDFEKLPRKIQSDLQNKKPFPYWQFENFIDNATGIVEDIETELQEFPNWHRKENDLYSLYQTDDFKSINPTTNPALFSFRQFLYSSVKDWLHKLTGIELVEQVDINGSCYAKTDGLLPHNDLIETRRFAFVYYVTPFIWGKNNGGELNLYNSDDKDQPSSVAIQLLPRRNSFLVFEVSNKSWHKVSEILQEHDPRLSINGWFHSKRRLEAKSAPLLSLQKCKQLSIKNIALSSIINKLYQDSQKQEQIQDVFGDTSEVSLKDFLKRDIASSVTKELCSAHFDGLGPPNKRNIKTTNYETAGENCKRLSKFLKSSTMAKFVSDISGCQLKDCQISLTLTEIQQGSYTVLGDEDVDKNKDEGFSLDTHLFLSNSTWNEQAGGDVIYVGKDDEEPLITIHPEHNTISLVLQDPEVLSFIKYTNSLAEGCFYHFKLTYHQVQVEDSEDEKE